MCCLFGLIDYKGGLSAEQKTQVVRILAAAAEERGTDAAGIAYNDAGRLRIYKCPGPAHKIKFHVPAGAGVVMGHTRMTTQGSAQKNRNNHPFIGKAGRRPFALAHNGVLWNDDGLRKQYRLPDTKIQTDSYVAVQLIEQRDELSFQSLRDMAELLEGSFTITVLNPDDDLFFVKGDNPLCLYRYPGLGIYLYASTEEILNHALQYIQITGDAPERITLRCGEILRIRRSGEMDRSVFDDSGFYSYPYYWPFLRKRSPAVRSSAVEELEMVAGVYGCTPEEIEELLAEGYSAEELEEYLYSGEI